MDEMFGVVCALHETKKRLTVIIDKGMNSDGNYAYIDDHSQMHFVTTYSTYFAEELAATALDIGSSRWIRQRTGVLWKKVLPINVYLPTEPRVSTGASNGPWW
jgi:transposase